MWSLELPMPVHIDAPSLNQTYGWGCESGDSFGSGTSFDGGGIGTNQPDTGVWQVYSAVGTKGGAVHAPTQLGGCSDGWHCSSTDGAGNSYDGNSGWQVVDSYSCRSGECGSYGVDHSIVQTDGTTQLAEGGKVVLGDEVIDFPAGTGDVHVPADQIAPDMYAGGIFDLHQPISPLLAQTGTSSLASAPLGDEVFDFTGNAGDVHAPVEQYSTVDMYKPISPLLAQTGTSSLAAAKAPYVFQVNSDAGTCDFSCDQNAVCSEPVGACSSVKVGVVPSQTVCVGSTCINASDPNTITVQYALAPPPAIPTVEAQRAAVAQSSQKGVRPSPAHFVMAAHAAVYGYLTAYLLYCCLSATSKFVSGESKVGWYEDFKVDASDAAYTVTPIGGHVLRSAFARE